MNFGLRFDFRNPPQWRRPWDSLYTPFLDQMVAAESLGYDAIWLSEHHFLEDGYLPSLLPIAAAVAARTQRLLIGTSVLLLPLHDALRVAEDAAVVDIISGGRFMLGVGLGYRLEEFRTFGVPVKERVARLEEGLHVIHQAWTQERVTFHGRHYHLDEVTVTPRPVQQPHPSIWLGGSVEKAAQRAGRLGYGFKGNELKLAEAYRQAVQEHWGDRVQPRLGLGLLIHIAEDPEAEWHRVKAHIAYRHNAYIRWYAEAGVVSRAQVSRAPVSDPEELRRHDPNLVIDPDGCVKLLRPYLQEPGLEHIYFWGNLPGLDPEHSFRSVELFARKVLPRLRSEGSGA